MQCDYLLEIPTTKILHSEVTFISLLKFVAESTLTSI